MRLVGKFCSSPIPLTDNVVGSVVSHLQHLLNSTADFAYFPPDYGIPCHIGDRPSPQLLQTLCDDIKFQIDRWESRFDLKEISFEIQDDASWITLLGDVESKPCKLNLYLNRSHI